MQNNINQDRLLSLDVMRGLIMILLAAESCHLYIHLRDLSPAGGWQAFMKQFFHHPWHGLHFWDLVQPAFMTMAGSALYISWSRKVEKGIPRHTITKDILFRSLKLFICGVGLHCVYAGKLVWELWNVLTQLSVTTLIAYAIIRLSGKAQIIISLLLLLLTEILYRTVLQPGFSEPFTEHKNFGAWMDTIFMGKINSDGWVTINFIPTAAHTIWGVVAGRLLISPLPGSNKIRNLVLAGIAALLAGYALDLSGLTPIIKRISTSSFVLASGGWVLLILAFLYWLNDILKWNRNAWILTVVGMNAIFIYLFFETVGHQWLNKTTGIFAGGFSGMLGAGEKGQHLFTSFVTLFLEWGLCYWLFKRKIFFKL